MKADIVHHFTGQTVIAIPGVTSIRHLKLVLDELDRPWRKARDDLLRYGLP